MRTKRRPRGFWIVSMCALMPPVYVRCSTPGRAPLPEGAQDERLAAAGAREAIDELRNLVAKHGEFGERGDGSAPRSPTVEREHYDAASSAAARLEGVARAAAGPCAWGAALPVEVAAFERLAAALHDEIERHRERSAADDSLREGEEARHHAEALDLLDDLERAYAAVEQDARQRASLGCLWHADV